MKFSIYKTKQNRIKPNCPFGTVEASCIEVASDLLFKKLRKRPGTKDGDVFLIIQDTGKPLSENFVKEGASFRLIQYREFE